MVNKRRSKLTAAKIRKFINQPVFGKFYLIGSIVILGITTMLWSLIGSWIQNGNADQLANSFLTESAATFQGAVLPDQHSFLLKLPFFWLVQLLGGTPAAFSIVTVLVVCLTVGLFAFVLYRFQPRPLVIGTIYLALALVLIMIPAEPSSYSLLPVNMAMLTTRNLEYILFIGIILLVIKAHKWVSWRLLIALLLMVLLVASDKLFLSLGIAGAFLFTTVSLIPRFSQLRSVALRWLAVSILGSVGALLLLHAVTALDWLRLDGHNIASPYGVIESAKDAIIAVFYAIAGVFTNFGANPAFESRTITDLPAILSLRLLSPLSYAYLGTLNVFIIVVVALYKQLRNFIKKKSRTGPVYSDAFVLTLILIATSLAALGAFIVSDHYYPVDARYLAIFLFTGFVGLAAFPFKKRLPAIQLVGIGIFLLIALIPALSFPSQNLQSYQAVAQQTLERDTKIAHALATHPVDTVLGDYWRVLPIKQHSKGLTVTPLSNCTENRSVLTSKAWQPNLDSHSFAYLLSLDGSRTSFPQCSLETVTDAFGKPDSSVVISGTAKEPKELLLFYDKGIHKVKSTNSNRQAPDTVIPISLDATPFRICIDGNNTIMNFVAHEDDDILFMNPDLYHDINGGNCVRTVFLTAGDAGSDSHYWTGRQRGAETAYAAMLGTPDVAWTERIVEVSPNHFATIANPRGNHKISLIFLHLPDGNMNGRGFRSTTNQSLDTLYKDKLASIQTVDHQSTYTSAELKKTLQDLMSAYLPDAIRAQSADSKRGKYIDHSDHTAVGAYIKDVSTQYIASSPSPIPTVTYYLGYPIHDLPENVTGDDLAMKIKTFLDFGRFDGATCTSLVECDRNSVYGIYLRRQYTNPF